MCDIKSPVSAGWTHSPACRCSCRLGCLAQSFPELGDIHTPELSASSNTASVISSFTSACNFLEKTREQRRWWGSIPVQRCLLLSRHRLRLQVAAGLHEANPRGGSCFDLQCSPLPAAGGCLYAQLFFIVLSFMGGISGNTQMSLVY